MVDTCIDNGTSPRGCGGSSSGDIGDFVEDDKSQFGGWVAARSGVIPDAYGLCQSLNVTDVSSVLETTADGITLRQDTGAVQFTDILIGGGLDWIFAYGIDFLVKIKIPDITNVRFAFGLSVVTASAVSDPGVDHSLFQYDTLRGDTTWHSSTRSDGARTLTDMGITLTTDVFHLRITHEPSTRETYRIYDREFNLLASSSEITNIPRDNELTRFQVSLRNFESANKSINQFFAKIKVTPV